MTIPSKTGVGIDPATPHDLTVLPTRRRFLAAGSGLAAVLALGAPPSLLAAQSPSSKVRVAVIGLGRGAAHVNTYLQIPGVEIAALCDVDERRIASVSSVVRTKAGYEPAGIRDFRRILDDRTVDAVSIAMPNFWHAPATILACAAGKHVYVEKPGSHNAREAELMVAAARKHRRVVQMGSQRRSTPEFIEAIELIRKGEIGPVRFARCWYSSARPSIGRGKPAPVPAWLDYGLWQGPVPERPYMDNLVHYNWHWRWHWGGGELANNGIHALDIARWGLGVTTPRTVSCTGGRYHFQDDQETPDTIVATYDFGGSGIVWDGSSCVARTGEALPFVTFYGDGASLSMDSGAGWRIVDHLGKPVRSAKGRFVDVPHFTNFIEAIRSGATLNAEIGEGQKSTMLCHLGNIAYRTRSTLKLDAATGKLVQASGEARRLWGRDYRRGWEPKV